MRNRLAALVLTAVLAAPHLQAQSYFGQNKVQYCRLDFEVMQHEMVHQFQFDIFARGQIGAGLARLAMVQPPLWFMEGMAEYLSLGPIDAITGMWLRDASLEGQLPSIEALTFDPRVFPYHFG